MKIAYFIPFILAFAISSCSTLENTFYLKNNNKNDGWERIMDQHYKPYYSYYSNLYIKSNKIDTISVRVSSKSKMLFLGPPLIPIFPVFYFKGFNNGIFLTLYIKSNKYDDVVNLLRHVRFTFNDSLDIIPEKKFLWKNGDYIDCQDCTQQIQGTYKNEIMSNGNLTHQNAIRVGLRFNINPRKVKKVIIIFNEELSSQLNLGVNSLELRRNCHLHYSPFIYMAH